jgi:transcription initiation factor IIE alpha subunit
MTPTPQDSETPERKCPNCNGSLERYEDPKAVAIIEKLSAQLLQLKKENGELLKLLHDEGAAARWRLAQRGIHTQSPESLMKGI